MKLPGQWITANGHRRYVAPEAPAPVRRAKKARKKARKKAKRRERYSD